MATDGPQAYMQSCKPCARLSRWTVFLGKLPTLSRSTISATPLQIAFELGAVIRFQTAEIRIIDRRYENERRDLAIAPFCSSLGY
jgi:hypothetical protein